MQIFSSFNIFTRLGKANNAKQIRQPPFAVLDEQNVFTCCFILGRERFTKTQELALVLN